MCGGGGSTPRVVERDPIKEQLDADRRATKKANSELAVRRKNRRFSSLLATGGGRAGLMATGAQSVLASAQGKDTLG
jgi:hypothetical protein